MFFFFKQKTAYEIPRRDWSSACALPIYPGERAKWQAQIEEATPKAVEEIVRAASPVTFMRRTVTRDLTLSNHHFKEGDKVVLFYGAANRDPRVFDDPETFDIGRDPNPHVGFGGPGPHFCLGAHLARRELSVVFRQLEIGRASCRERVCLGV